VVGGIRHRRQTSGLEQIVIWQDGDKNLHVRVKKNGGVVAGRDRTGRDVQRLRSHDGCVVGLRSVQHGYAKNGQLYDWCSAVAVEVSKEGHVTDACLGS